MRAMNIYEFDKKELYDASLVKTILWTWEDSVGHDQLPVYFISVFQGIETVGELKMLILYVIQLEGTEELVHKFYAILKEEILRLQIHSLLEDLEDPLIVDEYVMTYFKENFVGTPTKERVMEELIEYGYYELEENE